MSDGAAQNGGNQAASTGEVAVAAAAAVTATAAPAAPVTAQTAPVAAAVPAAPLPAAPAAVAAFAQAAVAPAAAPAAADCEPPKKKVSHKHDKKETEEEHARATTADEDQNLSQPADGCVLPQTGAAPAPVADAGGAPVVVDDVDGGGISSGLLIGAGVLAAIGVGVLALAKDDEDKNAPPTATADTGAVNEGATLSGSVATNDSDPNNDPLTYALTGTAPAGLTLNSNGSYTFDANNAAYNALVAGATQVVTANYSVSDGKGGTANSTLTITVTGTNDLPNAVADTATATEGGAVVTGNVATNDTDADTGQTATLTYTLAAPVAGLTLNANGTYSFDPTNAAYNSLAAGQTQTVVANVVARDASNGTTNSTLTFTVTGANDQPVAVADTNAGLEDTQITGSVATNDTDPDAGATLTYTVVGTPPAGFTLNANGTYTLDTTNAAYQGLNAGQVQNVVVNYQVSDGTATATSTLTIAVTGVNDGPVVTTVNLDTDDDANPNTARVFDGGTGAVNFTDDNDVANLVIINNFGQDDYITFDAAFTGDGRPSFASGDFDNDNVADDLRITTNINGVVSDLVLTNVVTAGVLVFDEATADAAVAGTDNFRSTGTPTTPTPPTTPVGTTAQALEADDNTNPNDYRTFNAGTGSFRFTDDADAANNTIIVGLSTNDQIVLEAGNVYSFSSGDRDGDGLGNDIIITLNKGGVVSELILKDAVVNNNLVFNEASAEQALGNIDYFSFA